MITIISRRDFLKQSLFSAAAASYMPLNQVNPPYTPVALGRITTSSVRVRQNPSSDAETVYKLMRDNIVQLYETIEVEGFRNPYWYRVWGGYLYSSYVQTVQFNLTEIVENLPEGGCLFEVSVPYTRSYRFEYGDWIPNYRLYFNSTHWVDKTVPGPDGERWYQLVDSFERNYYVRASHLRQVDQSELTPISPDVPRNNKWVEVSVADQTLRAFENGEIVLDTKISSGLPLNRELEEDELPTETPVGDHFITVKSVSRHMGVKNFTDELESGAYPGVPWVCFFDVGGYSLHGTYWHGNFGNRMSHGCVNMRCEDAKWMYRWSLPAASPADWQTDGWGIRVSIRE